MQWLATEEQVERMDYTAEAFDQMQRLWSVKEFNDHNLHCVLRFEHRLDAASLKRAVMASIEAFPILATRYISGVRPRWTSLDPEDFDSAFVTAQVEAEFEDFVASKVDEGIGPQVRVCLLDSMPSSSIALKMNHMVCDAADFKTYLYFLSRIYTQVLRDPDYQVRPDTGVRANTADRSVHCVLKRFHFGVRLKSLLLQSGENNRSGRLRFPLGASAQTQPFILTRKLGRERTSALKRYGRAKGATLNDVVLTAFYRCLFRRLALHPGRLLRVPVMVDMRRYVTEQSGLQSLSNLTSTVSTQLECRPTELFEDTLARVKAIMDHRKRSNAGLNGLIKLDRVYRILGNRIANRLLIWKLKHPLISMTNTGILDPAQLWFGDRRPCDAFLCGSIKCKPYFQLAISSYDGALTLSTTLLGSEDDRDRILSFFDELDEELSHAELLHRVVSRSDRGQREQAFPGTLRPNVSDDLREKELETS
jgi:NRPS condensation-like uncharacterized protein